jgi:hypothetical protein
METFVKALTIIFLQIAPVTPDHQISPGFGSPANCKSMDLLKPKHKRIPVIILSLIAGRRTHARSDD